MTKPQVRIVLILLAVAVVALLFFRFFGPRGSDEEEIVTDVGVHVGKIARATLHRYVTAYGTVEPEPPGAGRAAGGALISAPAGGLLTEIACTEGKTVEKGALLFRFDTRLAEAAVARATQGLATAEQAYDRQKKLLEADGTSQKNFQEAELGLATARSELSAARTELSLLEIRAPLSGTVVRIDVRLGQAVDASAVLAEVVALDRLVVNARVPSREAGELKPGQPVIWGEGTAPAGTVLVVGRDIDPQTDTMLVRAAVPPGAGFRPGQFLPLRIVAEERRDVLSVPEVGLIADSVGGASGWIVVVDGSEAARKPVKAGLREGGLVEVEGEGLREGLAVVTIEAYSIVDPTKVHIINAL